MARERAPKAVVTFDFTGDLEALRSDLEAAVLDFAAVEATGRYNLDTGHIFKLFYTISSDRLSRTERAQFYPKLEVTNISDPGVWGLGWKRSLAARLRSILASNGARNIIDHV